MRLKIPYLYFGWWMTIAVSFFFSITCGFGMQGASIIFKPVAGDLGLSREATSVAMGIASLQNGIIFPFAGWFCDKYGSKILAIAGCLITGAGLILMNFIQTAWQFYIVWGVLIAGGNTLGFSVSIDKVITNWFIRKRGTAFSIRFAIVAVVGMILLPVISILVTSFGWRTASLIWSILAFATLPVAFYFVPQHRPEHYGLLPDGVKPDRLAPPNQDIPPEKNLSEADGFEEQEFTVTQALKTPTYWMLTIMWILYFAVFGGITVHLVPMFTDIGFSPVDAASLVALMSLIGMPASFFSGLIADRLNKYRIKYLLAIMLSLMALGVWAMCLSQQLHARVYLFLVLFGLGSAVYIPMDVIIRSRFYGRKAYGSIQSISVIFSAPISFFAPVFSGWVYDRNGSYLLAFLVYAVMASVMAFITFLLRVPKLPAVRTTPR